MCGGNATPMQDIKVIIMANKPVQVTYKNIDGAHFFVSYDKDAAGLCVANADFRKAYEEVGKQLHVLYKLNHGEDAEFQPNIPFEQFRDRVKSLFANVSFDDEDAQSMVPAVFFRWARGRTEFRE